MKTFEIVDAHKLPPRTDQALMAMLLEAAEERADGHLTIMKFTTNWRVCVGTPEQVLVLYGDGPLHPPVEAMPEGKTFREAAYAALRAVKFFGEPPDQAAETCSKT